MPELPDELEALCWILYRGEGWTQAAIADELGVGQPRVSRMLGRAERKADALLRIGITTREQLEQGIRRLVGLAPRS